MPTLKSWIKGLERRQRIVLVSSFSFVVLLLSVGGAAEYTSRPEFCPTCHYMEPYYESWMTAEAHDEVKCTTCHFPPGIAGTVEGKMEGLVQVVNYLTSSYTRRTPWAEIDDASCTQSGCHENRLDLHGVVDFQGVAFDHGPHLGEQRRGKELRCTSCHSQIVQGSHMRVTETTCFLCHMKNSDEVEPELFETLSDCETCHRWNDSTTVDASDQLTLYHQDLIERDLTCDQCHGATVVGDGFVPPQSCINCHSEPARLTRISDTHFVHEKHISENKIECVQCHLQIQHKIQRVDMERELACATCHQSTHGEQVMLFTGQVPGQASMPSPMFTAGLDCAGCHAVHADDGASNASTMVAGTCESCHGEGYDRLLTLWQEGAEDKMRDFRSVYDRVARSVRGTPAARKASADSALGLAQSILHVVQVGRPVHNVQFYDELIRGGYDHLARAAALSGSGVRVPAFQASSTVPGECANCHTGVERIEVPFGGRTFAHEQHVLGQGLTCSNCHSNSVRHGQLVQDVATCNSCHHREDGPREGVGCESCHATVAQIYEGSYLQQDTPDYMADSGVICEDCHRPGDDIVRPELAQCADCHDEDYIEYGQEWRDEVTGLLADLREALTNATAEQRALPEFARARGVLNDFEAAAAGGLHNYELTYAVLEEMLEALETD